MINKVSISYTTLKRTLDISIAIILSCLLLPIVVLTSVILFINLGENPFFVQQRPGYKEKLFNLIKLKTMRTPRSSEKHYSDNHRVTKISTLIRKLRIDEFPQLANIIIGDMSFVGPRPLLVEYLPLYTSEQRLRHNVLPGIAGLAQVNGSEKLDFQTRLNFDIKYVKQISLLLDLKIILLTAVYIVKDFTNRIDHDRLPTFK